jgi:hypothetical protein
VRKRDAHALRAAETAAVSRSDVERSPQLEQVRRLLFPRLSPDEGWERIETAIARAGDAERMDAIEELAASGLSDDLAAELGRRSRGRKDQF